MSNHGANGSHNPNAWLKRVRHSGEYSDVTVRVALEEFKLHLLPLLSDSTYFEKYSDAYPAHNQDSKLVVDLPDFPCGPGIFLLVIDHWYGTMEQEISTSNVAEVICASSFLGVESLKTRAFKFLEENVFNCWKSCLVMLTTFDCEVPPVGDELFDRCTKALLDNIKTENPLSLPEYADCSMFCNVTHLSTVATVLPVNMAEHICHCIRDEALGLYYREEDMTEPPAILLCTKQSTWLEPPRTVEFNACWVTWLEKLPELMPNLQRRALLLLNLIVMITHGENVTRVCTSFLCLLLVKMIEASEGMASGDGKDVLGKLIENTEKIVGLRMGRVQSEILQKCKFATIVSMVKKVNCWWTGESGQQRIIERIAKVLDDCLLAHLNKNSLSVQQILIIYQNFPNNARSSHAGLHLVLKDVLQRTSVSVEQRHELSRMLDFEKLPDACVQRMFQESEVDHNPRLLKRVLEIHEKDITRLKNIVAPFSSYPLQECCSFVEASVVLVKHFSAFMTVAAEHEVQAARLALDKMKLASELEHQTAELTAANRRSSQLERELHGAQWALEAEKEKRLCEICNESPKDALILPCMHFPYCWPCMSKHMQDSKTCPTCTNPATEVKLLRTDDS